MKRIPFHKLFNPTLQALRKLGDSGTNQEIHDEAVVILDLTEEEIAELHKPGQSNQTRIAFRLSWARSWLKRYGLLENSSRGVWSLTPEGRSVGDVDSKEVVRAVNEIMKQERLARSDESSTDTDDEEDLTDVDQSTDNDTWRDSFMPCSPIWIQQLLNAFAKGCFGRAALPKLKLLKPVTTVA